MMINHVASFSVRSDLQDSFEVINAYQSAVLHCKTEDLNIPDQTNLYCF